MKRCVCLWVALMTAGIAKAVMFDATQDFSIEQGNPNGVWSYGWMQVGFGPLNLLTNKGYDSGGNPY